MKECRVFLIQIVNSLSDPYSGTVGGGNAPLRWLPTAVKHKEEEETGGEICSVCGVRRSESQSRFQQ